MTAWTAEHAPAPVTPGSVTLIEGTAFCVCGPSGDILPGGADGIFFRDTRLVSRWQLLVDGEPVEPLAVMSSFPFCATFAGRSRPRPGHAESTVLVTRTRCVGDGLREDIAVHNFSDEAAGLRIGLLVESDLADIFDVKANRIRQWGQRSVEAAGDGLTVLSRLRERTRGMRVSASEAIAGPGELCFEVVVPARETWRNTITVRPLIDGHEVTPIFPPDQPVADTGPARRQHDWERAGPLVSTGHPGLARALRRSRADLGSLRIFDTDAPDRPPGVAAGAPWFMTVFGRDSLLTSWMALPLDASLALGTLRMLADLQGEHVDAITEEEPGKIIHELRHGLDSGTLPAGSRGAYFGSIDATPLFVMLAGELVRWGHGAGEIGWLLPHVDRALRWIELFGDPDGDLFVEYARKTDRGLVNQGWKDSFDGINFADGTLAQAPIALAEVQGYVYAAYLARAHLAQLTGDTATRQHYADRAAALKRAFNEAFWLPDQSWYAVGLDRHKRPIDALASNMGHCLLTGIADADKATAVADKLMSPQMFSGWGIRTLASSMRAYNPMSYHNGSVWPHDNALIAAGLMRYGYVEQAQRIAMALLDAADAFHGRLPELFCGFDRAEYPQPLPYPTSCSPQAWAAATPVQLLRTLLRFDPCIPCGRVRFAPALPAELGELSIDRFSLAGQELSMHVADGGADLRGLPDGLQVIHDPEPLPGCGAGREGLAVNNTDSPPNLGPARKLNIAVAMPPWFDVPPEAYGGIESLVADLIDALIERGHEVVMLGAGTNRTRAEFRRTYKEAPSERIGQTLPEIVHAAWANRYLDELDVDVIHDHSFAGPLAARGRKVPTIVTAHGPSTGEIGSYYHAIAPDVSLVAISDSQRRLAPDLPWAATVHNAVKGANFTFREQKEDHVLFVGRMNPEKGAHLAIEAAREAGRRILLAGKLSEPHERDYFDAEVKPRLGDDAEFVGEADTSAKQELYGAAHCLVFPICWEEPFGLVMIEAMACGTPVVALRRGSVPEVVLDGTTGYVRDDPADLPAAINEAGTIDPAACRRHVEENFDLAVMTARYERVYAQAYDAA